MGDFLEYSFRIVGPKPETIPMARLACYMAELAKLMGSPEAVHFKEILDKSVSIVAVADADQVSLISPRIREAAQNDNDAEASGPWRKLNEFLAEDGWTAELPLPKGGEVIAFPGRLKMSKAIRTVNQHTSVQGRLVRIEGVGDLVKVGLDIDGNLTARISISASYARELGQHFHQHVRLSGEAFDEVIAIETGERIAHWQDRIPPADRAPGWKVAMKYDAMIASTAIVRGASEVYTTDDGLGKYLEGSTVIVKLIDNLPLPPEDPQQQFPWE